MGKHQKPPEDSEADGKVPDDVDLAKLLKEAEGKHTVDDDVDEEEDED